MQERLGVEAVAGLVGGNVVERAARHWVYAMRGLAEVATPTPDDVVIAPRVSAWALAIADLVEAFIDLEGGVDGLVAAEALGVDVSDALGKALAISAEAVVA